MSSGSPSWRRAQDVSWSLAQRSVLDDLEKQYLQLKQDRTTALDALQKEKAVVTQLQAELTASRQIVVNETQMQHELTVAKQTIAAKDEKQKLMDERMDRMQAEADQLRAEISRLSQSNDALQNELGTNQVASRLQESQAIPLLHEKHRLETELDSIQAHVSWLEQELADKQKLILKLRQDNSDHVLQLQLQLDMMANEKDAAVTKYTELSKMEHRLQEKVTELSRDLLELKQEKAQMEHDHEVDLASERKLNDLQKRQNEQLTQRCSSLEKQVQALQEAAEQAIALSDQEKQDLRSELEGKYQTLLEKQAVELQKQAVVPRLSGAARGLLLMDSARPAGGKKDGDDAMEEDDGGEDGDEPLGLTEMYTRYHETKRALRKERKQKEHCQSLLFDLQKEIEAAAPGLVQQREEYDRAMDRLNEYQERLHSALEERDLFHRESQEARHEVTTLHKEMKALKQENGLFAQQVQALLRKEAGGTVDPNFPVDIAQIQSQNQKLLAERIRLQEKVRELEGRLQSDILRTKLNATDNELRVLKEERKRQEEIVERLVQQRDLYRALASQGGTQLGSLADEQSALQQISQQSERSTRLEQKIRDLEKHLAEARGQADALKRENDDMSQRLLRQEKNSSELVDTIGQHERELLSARSKVARAESDAQYHREKCERLEESLQRSRNEVLQIGNANSQLQRINTDLHHAISKATSQCSSQESEKNQAEMKIRFLETQLQTARSSEGRLAEENNRMRAEMARQGSMMDDIRRIETRLVAKNEGEIAHAIEEAGRLRVQLQEEQSKNALMVDNLNEHKNTLEVRLHDSESAKVKLQEELIGAKKLLLEAQNEVKERSARCGLLEVQLRSARRKLGEVADDDETKLEMSLRNRIKTLDDELDIAKSEVDSWKKQAEHYQKIAVESDEALAELGSAFRALETKYIGEKDELQKMIESLQQDNAAKQQVVVELTNDLVSLRGQQEKAEDALRSKIVSLKAEIQNNKDDTDATKASAAAMKLDMERLCEERDVALASYERELTVHSESRTALRQAREQVEKDNRLRFTAEEKVESLRMEFDLQLQVWQQERVAMQDSIKFAEANLASTREQNAALHRQLDSLRISMEKQSAGTEPGSATELSSSSRDELQKSLAEAREIVQIVRSENEILSAELDNSKRLVERERAATAITRRSLDEARAELVQVEKQTAETDADAQVSALKEKIAALESQSSLLNDSNYVLRENVTKLQYKVEVTQNELDTAREALHPNEKAKHEQEARIAGLVAENDGLRRDLDDWKNRVQSIVSKFNQVDPVEHSQLKKKVEEVTKENESLSAWKRATEEENIRMRTIATKLKDKNTALQKEIQALKSQLSAASKSTTEAELAVVSKERDEFKAKIAELEKEAASRMLEASGLSTQTENLRKRLRQLMADKQEATNTVASLKASIASLETQLAAAKSKLSELASAKPTSLSVEAKSAMSAETLTTNDKTAKATEAEPPTVPMVPSEGFHFGPSERSNTDDTPIHGSPSLAKHAVTARSQPKKAVPVVEQNNSVEPVTAAPPQSAVSSLSSRALAFQPKSFPTAQSESSPTPPINRNEEFFKEKLLEKKRKLQEALDRQAAKDKSVTSSGNTNQGDIPENKQSSTEFVEDNVAKRRKTSSDEGEETVTQPDLPLIAPQISTADEEPAVHTETDSKSEVTGDVNETTEQSQPTASVEKEFAGDTENVERADLDIASPEGANEMVFEGDEEEINDNSIEVEPIVEMPVQSVTDKPTETITTLAVPSAQAPFGSFGSGSGSIFGQGLAGPNMGFGTLASSSTFGGATSLAPSGGAFLNIQPPGTSSTVPRFTFGNSPSITLPIPSQATPVASPFGAFGGSGVSSGSAGFTFGQSSSSFGARPLFGTPAPAADVMEAEQQEDEMEDNEGEMEAEE